MIGLLAKEYTGWDEAFGYAGEPDTCATSCQDGPDVKASKGRPDTPTDLFTREDVQEILNHREGDNDGPAWLMMGRLKDGRFFFLNASCDYTGWD